MDLNSLHNIDYVVFVIGKEEVIKKGINKERIYLVLVKRVNN
jgi:hypothetical protein